jgi:hypothetical protein
MIDRRHAIRLAVRLAIRLPLAAAALAAAAPPRAARAQPDPRRLVAFLIDLGGWDGRKPEGLDLEVPGSSVVTATREYRRGAARLSVQLVAGPTARGALDAVEAGVDVAVGDTRMRAALIDGLPVARSFTAHDRTGVILVALGPTAMFSVTFDGVGEDEALALARQFDWKAMRAAAPR